MRCSSEEDGRIKAMRAKMWRRKGRREKKGRKRARRTPINRDKCLEREQSDVLEVNWFYSRNILVNQEKRFSVGREAKKNEW